MIPKASNVEFQYLLAHTFPGFFLALTLFMLLDIWSPANLTSAIRDPEGLVSFAGFILVIGTILGIIIDGIHHIAIEDGIFRNLKEFYEIRKEINNIIRYEIVRKYMNSEREVAAEKCTNNLTPHFPIHYFYPCKNSESMIFCNDIVLGYYRYSEFFSNSFISLVLFSFIAPFFLFNEMIIQWEWCVFLGIFALVISWVCLIASYIAYERCLKAQKTLIYGICNIILEKEIDTQKDDERFNFLCTNQRIILISLAISLFYSIILYFIGSIFGLEDGRDFYVIFSIMLFVISLCITKSEYRFMERPLPMLPYFSLTISSNAGIFFVLVFLFFLPMGQISFNPAAINESTELCCHFNLGVTESMANIGSDLKGLSAKVEGFNESWINLSEMNTITNNSGSSIFLGGLKSDNSKYLSIIFNTNNITNSGIYRGRLIIDGSLKSRIFMKRSRNYSAHIPIILTVKEPHESDFPPHERIYKPGRIKELRFRRA